MRFGICTDFKKENSSIFVPHLDFIKKCGFDYLELNLTSISALTENEFTELNKYLNENGEDCLVCNCFMPASIPMTGESYLKDKFTAYVEKAVSRAKDLGCKKLVLGSGGSRSIPSGFDRATGEKQFEECLNFIISVVEKYGIQLELEHLNKGESNIVTTFEESSRMAEEKNKPSFKSIIDYYHFALGNEDLKLLCLHKNAVGHVHFAKPYGRCYPKLSDFTELEPFFTAIKSTTYNDTFSMECSFPDMEKEPEEYKDVLYEFKKIFNS